MAVADCAQRLASDTTGSQHIMEPVVAAVDSHHCPSADACTAAQIVKTLQA